MNAKWLSREFLKAKDKKAFLLDVKRYKPIVIRSFFKRLNNSEIKKHSFLNYRIETLDKFFERSSYKYSHHYNELTWNACSLLPFKEAIRKFEIDEQFFYQYLLLNDLDKAEIVLNTIEEEFGLSLWLFENRFLLYQKKYGLKYNKDYLEKCSKVEGIKTMTYHLLKFYSDKCEEDVGVYRFEESLKDVVKDSHITFSNYILFKLLPLTSNVEVDHLRSVMAWEHTNSFIDRYLSLKKIAYCFMTSDEPLSNKQYIADLCSPLFHLNESALSENLNLRGEESNENNYENVEEYIRGNYFNAADQTLMNLSTKPFDVFSIDLLAKCYLRDYENAFAIRERVDSYLGVGSVVKDIFECFVSIYLCDENIESSKNKLKKTALEISSSYLQVCLNYCLLDEYFSADPDHRKPLMMCLVSTPAQHPKIIRKLNDLKLLGFRLGDELFEKTLSDSQQKIKSLQASFDAHSCDGPMMLSSLDKIDDKGDSLLKTRLLKLKILYSLETHELPVIARFFTSVHMENSFLIPNDLWHNAMFKVGRVSSAASRLAFDQIETPIFYELLKDQKPDLFDKNARHNLNFYLLKNSIDTLEALVEDSLNFGKLGIFFLDKVVNEANMELCGRWSGSEQINSNRIFVCQKIIEASPEDEKGKFNAEIKKLTERNILSEMMKKLQKTRVKVNTDLAKSESLKKIDDVFRRARNLAIENVQGVREVTSSLLNDSKVTQVLSNELSTKLNVQLTLGQDIVETIYEEFIVDKKHGLDSFLGQNIRHGAMEEQLRSVVEVSHVVTKKNAENTGYLSNDFILDKLSYKEADSRNELDDRLGFFSNNVDKLIHEASIEWVSIKNEKSPLGLFDFSSRHYRFSNVIMFVLDAADSSDFFDVVTKEYWSMIEHCLKNVKDALEQVFYEKFKIEVEGVKEAINHLAQDDIKKEDVIRAFDESLNNMKLEVENIKGWFELPSDISFRDTAVNLLWKSCEETIKNTYSGIQFVISQEIEGGLKVKGGMVRGLIDIVYILLVNIAKHSGYGKSIENVSFRAFATKRDFVLEMKNHVLNIDDEDELVGTIEYLNNNASVKALEMSANEKGSGHYKIEKILQYDLEIKNKSSFLSYSRKEKVFGYELKISKNEVLV